jgi:subtilase family serine protease
MKEIARFRKADAIAPGWFRGIAVTVLSTALAGATLAAADNARYATSGPPVVKRSIDLGPVDRSTPIEITLWLKLRDEASLDRALSAQRDKGAPFLSDAQIDTQLAPTATNVEAVSRFLQSRGLKITDIGAHNLFVRAAGTVGLVQSAFRVEMHQYRLNDTTFRATPTSAVVPAEIAPLVASVSGLSSLTAKPNVARNMMGRKAQANVARQTDAEGLPADAVPLAAAGPNGLIFSAQCFLPPTSVTFSGNGATATYQGNRYGQPISNTASGNLPPCGYQPSDVQTAYNLKQLYKAGLDGTGETVAIVDAYGSTTVAQDLAAFSAFMGLPPANLTVIGTPTESNFSTDPNAGWATETTLDVEWVHSVAPGAKIVLVVAKTNSTDDLFAAILTAASVPGVVAISNSWSSFEIGLYPDYQIPSDAMFKLVGSKGISLQFATGDSGNNAVALGYYDVGWPASSPNVTAIGGVSAALNSNKHIAFQTAWGNNITEIADTAALGNPPIDPPFNEGFVYGGGGGTSDVYPLPDYQKGLGGERRKIPDISWLADPYTGVEIIYTADAAGDLSIEVIGGTSLATPMFSALWAIANQRAGHPLGLATPYLYRMSSDAITDIDAVTSQSNVTGTITDSGGSYLASASDLAAPLQGLPEFYSALYNSPHSTRWFVLTFGTDSTLKVGPGWDPATGLGTPNGWNFVQAFGHGHDD